MAAEQRFCKNLMAKAMASLSFLRGRPVALRRNAIGRFHKTMGCVRKTLGVLCNRKVRTSEPGTESDVLFDSCSPQGVGLASLGGGSGHKGSTLFWRLPDR
jgi:hypothetical protein